MANSATAYVALDSFVTMLNGQRRFIRRGRSYPGDDPVVIARAQFFRALKPHKAEAKPKRGRRADS
jgi:hypothetical protein